MTEEKVAASRTASPTPDLTQGSCSGSPVAAMLSIIDSQAACAAVAATCPAIATTSRSERTAWISSPSHLGGQGAIFLDAGV